MLLNVPRAAVTVAVPYAGGSIEHLTNAWNSFRDQDVADWKAIIVDDSSNSASLETRVRDWQDPRLSYRRNEGAHGIGSAWNACIDAVDTDLFCLLHQDDALEPDYLRRMLTLATTHPDAALYFCGAHIIDSKGEPRFSLADTVKEYIEPSDEPLTLRGPSAVASLMVGNYIMCPTLIYRRSAIGSRRFSTAHRFVLDLRFTLTLLFEGGTIVGTHRKAYRYRRHDEQSTHGLSKDGLRFQEELALFREVATLASARGWRNAAVAARMRPTFRLNALLSRRFGYAFV